MSIMQWLKRKDTILVLVIIVLFVASTIYAIVQDGVLKNVVACNKKTIERSNNALISRDTDKVAADESSLRADDARQKVILFLLSEYENGQARSLPLDEVGILKREYLDAVNSRKTDLKHFIDGAHKAPLSVYACP